MVSGWKRLNQQVNVQIVVDPQVQLHLSFELLSQIQNSRKNEHVLVAELLDAQIQLRRH